MDLANRKIYLSNLICNSMHCSTFDAKLAGPYLGHNF